MNTQTRLLALFGLLLTAFSGSAWLLHRTQAQEAAVLLSNLREEREQLLDHLLDLHSQSLRNFTTDYSVWSEMVAFVGTGDPSWAELNIDVSLPNFNLHAAWVLRPDGSPVYQVRRDLDAATSLLPLAADTLLRKLERDKFSHFYFSTTEGLMEVRAAPIQPTEDVSRSSPPAGWFLAGRLWNHDYLNQLRSSLNSTVRLQSPSAAPPPRGQGQVIKLHRELRDWEDQAIMVLHTDYDPRTIRLLLEENKGEMALFVGFGLTALALTAFGLTIWVIRPLRLLESSLAGDTPAPLARLNQQTDEFGRLARLVTASFRNRTAMELEIADRRRAEAALLRSEEQLRESAGLQVRLARDLHDGVIQSIYAAGLGLASVRAALRTDPELAEERIDAASLSLNRTIREVREYITTLEPEETARPPFQQSLHTLVTTLNTLHSGRLECTVPPGLVAGLGSREEVHALQIVRECISNAQRHGNAGRITVGLDRGSGSLVLTVTDNGSGFDPAATGARPGSGLANIAARAAEIGARLTVDSAPGKGTRIAVTFSQTSLQ